MYLVKDWLKEFVFLPKDTTDEEIARRLSLSTVEVEGITRFPSAGDWDHIVVGLITALDAHPNADRVCVAHVDCGEKKPRTIVCGGSTLAVGMKVALALPGARVRWHGEGEPIVLQKAAVRGIQSNGMICASAEVGLEGQFPAKEEREILDLSSFDAAPGTPLSRAFPQETVIDIDNKSLSHRPDLWGHRGVARELSALFGAPFRDKKLPSVPSGEGHALRVEVMESDLCSRYIGIVVDGVHTASAPAWMQRRLRACGVRPVNAIVDITNYVMLEYGQPMHAFDFDAIAVKKKAHIVVRRAREGEKIRALDADEYALSPEMLIIANHEHPIAIAGVMGGMESGVSERTTTIIFEAAHFAPVSVRRTAVRLGLVSESSRRFEKDLDPELPGSAMVRALQLCAEIFPKSRVSSSVRDVYRSRPRTKPLVVTAEQFERRLGVPIPLGRAATILQRLGFGVRAHKGNLALDIPSFRRKDIAIPEDIIEEVLRFIGYDSVSPALPRITHPRPHADLVRQTAARFGDVLQLQYAFRETRLYAFLRAQTIRACGLLIDDHFELENPLSKERPYLCTSLVPNLLEMIERTQQKEKRIALFEVNRVFRKGNGPPVRVGDQGVSVPSQPLQCAFVFSSRDEENPFAYCADAVSAILAGLGWHGNIVKTVSGIVFEESVKTVSGIVFAMKHDLTPQKRFLTPFLLTPFSPLFDARRSAVIKVADSAVGAIGHIAPLTRAALGISVDTVACEVDLSALAVLPRSPLAYYERSAFPPVVRDATFVVDEQRPYREIFEFLTRAHTLISFVEPFAVYRSAEIGAGKKSLSFHMTYRAIDRTLTGEEVDVSHAAVVALLKKKFNAEVR